MLLFSSVNLPAIHPRSDWISLKFLVLREVSVSDQGYSVIGKERNNALRDF